LKDKNKGENISRSPFMNKDIYIHFSKTVDDYDTVADKVVMKNAELHNCLVNSIYFDSRKNLNILDLGSGTGHGMSLILKKFPKAKVTGIDFSHKMIAKSRKKLREFLERVRLIEKDFNEIEFNEKYDAIVSAVAIHNSSHKQKDGLFKKIYNSLNEGGLFVNGDFIEGESPEMNEQFRMIYRNFLEKNLSGHELKVWLRHAFEEDMPMALSQQFKLLKKHSFYGLELVWQFNNEVVYVARK